MRKQLLVLCVVTACGPRDWRPPANADQVAIGDGLIARAENDDTVSVTAIVSLEGVAAAGSIRLRATTLDGALHSDHVRLARARAWQALANMLEAKPEQAYEAMHRGHLELYMYSLDDSGNRSKAAEALRVTDAAGAYQMMTDVVRSHLRWYVRRYHDQLW